MMVTNPLALSGADDLDGYITQIAPIARQDILLSGYAIN
jgi:hypothetical protein